MNDLPRQKLCEIVARIGRAIIDDERRCEALLRDYCPTNRREISVLMNAFEERIPADLIAGHHARTPRLVLLARLTRRLCDNQALSEEAAQWGVETWALALGIISNAELKAIERARSEQVKPTDTVSKVEPVISSAAERAGKTAEQIHGGNTTTASAASRSHITVATSPPPSSPPQQVIVVSSVGEGDYATIGEAIKRAAPGARLFVRPGLYNEGFTIEKELEIIGDGARDSIIVESANAACITMRAAHATVRNLTLRERAGRNGGGNNVAHNAAANGFFAIDILQGSLTLEDCDITSNSLSCIGVHGSMADPQIRRCRIHDGADSGIYFFDAARGHVEECDIYNHANVSVAITQRAQPLIERCRIRDGHNAGIVVWREGAGRIEECEIFGHTLAGVGISEAGDPILRHCRIYGGRNSGVYVHENGAGTFEDCFVYDNTGPEVAVTHGGNPILRRCKIFNGQTSGALLRENGQGLFEECEIHNNTDAGIAVVQNSVAAIRRCRINRNGKVAIRVKTSSAASVENCDLSGNRIAAWETESGVFIEQRGNRL